MINARDRDRKLNNVNADKDDQHRYGRDDGAYTSYFHKRIA